MYLCKTGDVTPCCFFHIIVTNPCSSSITNFASAFTVLLDVAADKYNIKSHSLCWHQPWLSLSQNLFPFGANY